MPRPRYQRTVEFIQAAHHRFGDAEILLKHAHLTGAYYLAGYGVECILKALILSSISNPKRRAEVDRSFRGQIGHDIEGLRHLYVKESGRTIPGLISHCLTRVKTWQTDLRYKTSVKSMKQTVAFMNAVADVARE